MACLAYPFWPLVFLVVYLSPEKRRIRFLRYHSYQAFFLGLALWGGGILLHTVAALIGKYLVLLGVLLYPLMRLVGWAAMGAVAYGMYKAYRGEYATYPYVTEFALGFIDEDRLRPAEDTASTASEEEAAEAR
ncbi:MAG: hypothetical protein AB1758_20620 [Candidatus Eremiobacterota bacterium]